MKWSQETKRKIENTVAMARKEGKSREIIIIVPRKREVTPGSTQSSLSGLTYNRHTMCVCIHLHTHIHRLTKPAYTCIGTCACMYIHKAWIVRN